MMSSISKALIISGIILILVGVLFQFAPRLPWLGRLPGDIYIRNKNFSFYLPLSTSILVSIIISLLLYLLARR